MDLTHTDMYKLHDWIPERRLDIGSLCLNSHIAAIPIIERHIKKVNWSYLSTNWNAFHILKKHVKRMNWELFCMSVNGDEEFAFLEQHFDKIDWDALSLNHEAGHILEKNLDLVNFSHLSANVHPVVLPILKKRLDKIDWSEICFNHTEEGIQFIEQHLDKIDWSILSGNTMAIHILEKHLDKVDWYEFSKMEEAIHILEKHLDKVDWRGLSMNRAATHILEQHLDKVVWEYVSSIELIENHIDKIIMKTYREKLSRRCDDNTISTLEEHVELIDWDTLSSNKCAVGILKKYPLNINWSMFSRNPAIFTYDYTHMKERCSLYKEELMSVIFHPKNYEKFASLGFDEFTD